MTSISFRSTARIFIAGSIALTAAMLATAQTPGYIPPPPGQSAAKPAAPNDKAAAPEDKGSRRTPRTKAPAKSAAAAPAPEDSPVYPLAWLAGCWASDVNKRETREQWLPLRGDLMLGMSQTVVQGKTQDYEYLRMESRPDGVYYVVLPSGQNATTFKFEGKSTITMGDRSDDAFTFTNPALEFPSKIVYRRARQGWLYVSVEGKVKGSDKEVTYPMRRIDCETSELIER